MANKKLVKILSLDGGGIRGVIMAMILTHIERQTGKPVSESFDLIAGTSAGGLLALGLTSPDEKGKPKYSAEDVADMYEYIAKTVFTRSYWSKIPLIGNLFGNKYTPVGAEKLIRELCGNLTLKDALCEVLVTSFDI